MTKYSEYRLKKDMPDIKAGTIFTMDDSNRLTTSINASVLFKNRINNFDDWFEPLGEKLYRRQLIRYITLPTEIDPILGYKALRISFHMLKTFYYDDPEWGIRSLDKGKFEWVCISDSERLESIAGTIRYLNQLVSDGYIEIEDNPNIDWSKE